MFPAFILYICFVLILIYANLLPPYFKLIKMIADARKNMKATRAETSTTPSSYFSRDYLRIQVTKIDQEENFCGGHSDIFFRLRETPTS